MGKKKSKKPQRPSVSEPESVDTPATPPPSAVEPVTPVDVPQVEAEAVSSGETPAVDTAVATEEHPAVEEAPAASATADAPVVEEAAAAEPAEASADPGTEAQGEPEAETAVEESPAEDTTPCTAAAEIVAEGQAPVEKAPAFTLEQGLSLVDALKAIAQCSDAAVPSCVRETCESALQEIRTVRAERHALGEEKAALLDSGKASTFERMKLQRELDAAKAQLAAAKPVQTEALVQTDEPEPQDGPTSPKPEKVRNWGLSGAVHRSGHTDSLVDVPVSEVRKAAGPTRTGGIAQALSPAPATERFERSVTGSSVGGGTASVTGSAVFSRPAPAPAPVPVQRSATASLVGSTAPPTCRLQRPPSGATSFTGTSATQPAPTPARDPSGPRTDTKRRKRRGQPSADQAATVRLASVAAGASVVTLLGVLGCRKLFSS